MGRGSAMPLHPVATDLWLVEGGPQRVLGLPIPLRMTVLRLADGGLWLHSPVPHGPDLAAALRAIGPVRHLVAPATAHWTHLPGWQAAYPEARLWAAPGVVARAARQGVALRAHGELGAGPPPDWAGQVAQEVLRGLGFVEIAFHHRASGSLILTDTIQAMAPAQMPRGLGALPRLLGAAAPEGGTPLHVRLLLLRHRRRNRAAVQRLLGLAPRRVIFAHGAWYAEDGAARLRQAFAWLL
ncbi:DUF4336 domain-containing protein [Roseicella sp. DB1501]|nr:DUF4336 domain-containing protein [Roseicella sp. DB1501]